MRFRRSRSRHRFNRALTDDGSSRGKAVQSGSRSMIAASVSVTVSPAKACAPVSISYSTQPNAQMSRSLVHRLAAGLLRAHVRGGAENDPRLRHADVRVIVGDSATSPRAPGAASSALASPKSSTFTMPSGRELDVGRLQVAVDDALLVRGLERLGDLPGDERASSTGIGASSDSVGERRPLDQLHHQRIDAVAFFQPVDVRRCWGGSATPAPAPRAESGPADPDRRRRHRAALSGRRHASGRCGVPARPCPCPLRQSARSLRRGQRDCQSRSPCAGRFMRERMVISLVHQGSWTDQELAASHERTCL